MRAKRLPITPHYHIRKPTWLMLLCFYCEALFVVWLTCGVFFQNTLKVGINNIWGFHLFVVVLEGHLVLTLFRHLCSSWAFHQSFAFRLVPFEQFSRCIAVQTSFAKMFGQTIELRVFSQIKAVMRVFALFCYH